MSEVLVASESNRLACGRLELEFAADADGRSYLKRQFAGYPFHVCRASYQDDDIPGFATLYVQSCSGGIYENDRLAISVTAADNAQAHISTQAPTVVHSMPSGTASQSVAIHCKGDSYLEYLPDPQILFPESRFSSHIKVRLGGNAIVVISDSLLCHDPDGRGATFSDYLNEIVIADELNATLAIDRLKVDGDTFRELSIGALGRYKAQATMIIAGLNLTSTEIVLGLNKIRLDRDAGVIGTSHLPHSAGLLVRILATNGSELERSMHATWCVVRRALKGTTPRKRRK